MKLGLVIGRFQPMHNGHLSLIEKALEDNDQVLVLVGSTNRLPDFKNPFTAQERFQLINKVTEGLGSITVRALPDRPSDDEWIQDVVGHVLSIEEDPTEVTLYTSPKDEEWYRNNLLYPIEVLDEFQVSATEVRHCWYTDTEWVIDELLPAATLELLENHHDRERLTLEYINTQASVEQKIQGHPFSNPLEPVSFAVIVQGNKLLVGQRGNWRGKGQYGLAGGYVQNDETTLDGCMREVKEELNVDLQELIVSGNAQCLAQAVEENTEDIGTRTLGINYLFVIHPDYTVDVTVDGDETTDFKWVEVSEVLREEELLFFNHNKVVQRLLSKMGSAS